MLSLIKNPDLQNKIQIYIQDYQFYAYKPHITVD